MKSVDATPFTSFHLLRRADTLYRLLQGVLDRTPVTLLLLGITGGRMVIDYLTAILAFITAIYAYLTHRMAKASEASVEAMRNQTEAMLRPYVTVAPFIRPHTPFLYLRVKNSGRGKTAGGTAGGVVPSEDVGCIK